MYIQIRKWPIKFMRGEDLMGAQFRSTILYCSGVWSVWHLSGRLRGGQWRLLEQALLLPVQLTHALPLAPEARVGKQDLVSSQRSTVTPDP